MALPALDRLVLRDGAAARAPTIGTPALVVDCNTERSDKFHLRAIDVPTLRADLENRLLRAARRGVGGHVCVGYASPKAQAGSRGALEQDCVMMKVLRDTDAEALHLAIDQGWNNWPLIANGTYSIFKRANSFTVIDALRRALAQCGFAFDASVPIAIGAPLQQQPNLGGGLPASLTAAMQSIWMTARLADAGVGLPMLAALLRVSVDTRRVSTYMVAPLARAWPLSRASVQSLSLGLFERMYHFGSGVVMLDAKLENVLQLPDGALYAIDLDPRFSGKVLDFANPAYERYRPLTAMLNQMMICMHLSLNALKKAYVPPRDLVTAHAMAHAARNIMRVNVMPALARAHQEPGEGQRFVPQMFGCDRQTMRKIASAIVFGTSDPDLVDWASDAAVRAHAWGNGARVTEDISLTDEFGAFVWYMIVFYVKQHLGHIIGTRQAQRQQIFNFLRALASVECTPLLPVRVVWNLSRVVESALLQSGPAAVHAPQSLIAHLSSAIERIS